MSRRTIMPINKPTRKKDNGFLPPTLAVRPFTEKR